MSNGVKRKEPFAVGRLNTASACRTAFRRLAVATLRGDIEPRKAEAVRAAMRSAAAMMETEVLQRIARDLATANELRSITIAGGTNWPDRCPRRSSRNPGRSITNGCRVCLGK